MSMGITAKSAYKVENNKRAYGDHCLRSMTWDKLPGNPMDTEVLEKFCFPCFNLPNMSDVD